MAGGSNSQSSGERSDSSSTSVSRKRQASSVSPTGISKKRSTMQMDLDILGCPICLGKLTIPIFQCENGHLACSSCCPKLMNKCPSCALPIGHIRCRAMESVLSSISIPCPNTKFGCTEYVFYGLESTHEKECLFSPCPCPALGCDYTGSYRDVGYHYYTYVDTCLTPLHPYELFTYDKSSSVRMNISDKVKILVDKINNTLFAVQCFREPYGVCVTVSCIAPSSPEMQTCSYHLSYTVDGHTMTYKSPGMKNVVEVSFQTPLENFLFIPHSSLLGDLLEMKLYIGFH
ncbi:hypothetical protein CARUB_v10001631mg [Capsella rubella]|uniref:RING-type E3 ubiquitin transferase n=2 Tax=Capsella rubella TaxID=81985 RepID=R0HC58_9BRAS|nr:hypothetical protein CARUB_v10001631mg [Capsella rubella]